MQGLNLRTIMVDRRFGKSPVLCRFFCGPNAKKSAALAKQQKKRPRGDDKGKGKQAARDADSDEESAASDSGARTLRLLSPHAVAMPAHTPSVLTARWCRT